MIYVIALVVTAIGFFFGWNMAVVWERDKEWRKRKADGRPLREGYNPPPPGDTPDPPPICPMSREPIMVNPAMLLHPVEGDMLVLAVRGKMSDAHYAHVTKLLEGMLEIMGLKGKVTALILEDGAACELRKKPEAK